MCRVTSEVTSVAAFSAFTHSVLMYSIMSPWQPHPEISHVLLQYKVLVADIKNIYQVTELGGFFTLLVSVGGARV